ncbi:hypothetical protein ACWATR_22315 [Nostoc sp. UIC 10890]
MPTQKTRNYSRYVNDGKEEDAINRRLYKGGDRKNDACGGLRLRIPILFTISVLLGETHSLDCGNIGRDRFTRRLRDAMNRVFTRDCCFYISLMF